MCDGGDGGDGGDGDVDVDGVSTAAPEADVDDPGTGGGGGGGGSSGSAAAAQANVTATEGPTSAAAAANAAAAQGNVTDTEQGHSAAPEPAVANASPTTSTEQNEETLEETTVEVALTSVDPSQQAANLSFASLTGNIGLGATTAQEVAEAQQAHEDAMSSLDANVTEGGIGSLSPGVGLGVNSEMGTATFQDIAALNAPGLPGSTVGYAINDPTGNTPGAIAASQIAAQQNPSLANAMFGLAGMMPGALGVLGLAAGAVEGRGMTQAMGLVDSGRGAIAGTIAGAADSISGAMPGGASVMGQSSDDDPGEIGGPSQAELDAMEVSPADIDQVIDAGPAWSSDRVIDTTDSFLDTSQIQPLAEIPAATGVGTTGLLDDLGTTDITGATDSLSRPGSFGRSRITTPSNRIFNLVNLFRPTLSPGISL